MGIGSSSCSDHFRSIKKNHRSGELVLLNKHRERGHLILAAVWQLWPFFRAFNISDHGIPFKKKNNIFMNNLIHTIILIYQYTMQ